MTSTITSDKNLSYSFIEKLYQELGLDSLQQRRCMVQDIWNNEKPISQVPLISTARQGNMTRYKNVFLFFMFNWTILKILSSFQSNNIDFSIRKSEPGTFEETRIGFHKTFRK